MKNVFLLVVFVTIIFTFIGLSDSKKINIEKEWKRFKTDFNKTYESKIEEHQRFKIFKENLHHIQKHNSRYQKGTETYLQEINRFGDLTDSEFNTIYGLSEASEENMIYYDDELIVNGTSLPNITHEYLDWREAGAVTPVKDQGKCGSCWIFSTVGALESYNFRRTGNLLSFSEQNVVDCLSNDTCEGGLPYHAAEFVQNYGIYLESDYPYTARQDTCRNISKPLIHIDFNSTKYVYGSDELLRQGVKEHGPLSICLYVTAKWRFYSSGVWYHNECSPMTNHCVLLVGYGRENGNDYWLLKNSWGPHWGQHGYIKVARNKHPDYCGIYYGMYLVRDENVDENFVDNTI